MTFLFDKIIFGPVRSRRLGLSLGINLLPENSKYCNFNCIYCECGWTPDKSSVKVNFHSREKVQEALKLKLMEMSNKNTPPDVITFAGNGEPTLHPEFAGIIDDTIELRNNYFPGPKLLFYLMQRDYTSLRFLKLYKKLNKIFKKLILLLKTQFNELINLKEIIV